MCTLKAEGMGSETILIFQENGPLFSVICAKGKMVKVEVFARKRVISILDVTKRP
jgi:hypothetical protein